VCVVIGAVASECFIMRAGSNILSTSNPDKDHKISLLGYMAQNYTS